MNGDGSTGRGAGTGPVSGPATVPAVTGEGQLWALLQDLVAREGRDAAAVRLGLSERTIRRTLTDRHLSRRMTEALLRERDRRRAEQGLEVEEHEQPEQGEQLERRLTALETEFKDWVDVLCADLVTQQMALRSVQQRLGLGWDWARDPTPDRGLSERMQPELVTLAAAPDDAQIYREALPLVAEWRRTLRGLDEVPHTLAWLRLQERLLVVEIELLDDHRLTLPPAELPWDEVRRHDELRLRQRELADLRRQLAWTQVLHMLARIATLGLWGRAPSLERQLRRELRLRQAALMPTAQASRIDGETAPASLESDAEQESRGQDPEQDPYLRREIERLRAKIADLRERVKAAEDRAALGLRSGDEGVGVGGVGTTDEAARQWTEPPPSESSPSWSRMRRNRARGGSTAGRRRS